MNKKVVIILSILTISLSFVPLQEALSEEDTFVIQSIQTIDGSVQNINERERGITVHWLNDPVLLTYQDLILHVPDSTPIIKDSEKVRLEDLENGDHVTVRYDANAEPLPRAISIAVAET